MLVWATLFASLAGFLFGFDLGLIGGALLSISEEFGTGDGLNEVIVGAAKLGAVCGTFLGGALMLYYGRRVAIAVDSLFFITGPLLMAAAHSVAELIVGRFIVGVGIGASAVVVPAYLGEVSPAKYRGRVVELYEVLLCVGMLAAALSDAAFQNVPGNWRWMVGVPALPAVLMSFALCLLPESPRWLVIHGRLDEALAVIHRIYTSKQLPQGLQNSNAEVNQELLELWSSVEKDKAAQEERRRRRAAAREAAQSKPAPLASSAVQQARPGGVRFKGGWARLQEQGEGVDAELVQVSANAASSHGQLRGGSAAVALSSSAAAAAAAVEEPLLAHQPLSALAYAGKRQPLMPPSAATAAGAAASGEGAAAGSGTSSREGLVLQGEPPPVCIMLATEAEVRQSGADLHLREGEGGSRGASPLGQPQQRHMQQPQELEGQSAEGLTEALASRGLHTPTRPQHQQQQQQQQLLLGELSSSSSQQSLSDTPLHQQRRPGMAPLPPSTHSQQMARSPSTSPANSLSHAWSEGGVSPHEVLPVPAGLRRIRTRSTEFEVVQEDLKPLQPASERAGRAGAAHLGATGAAAAATAAIAGGEGSSATRTYSEAPGSPNSPGPREPAAYAEGGGGWWPLGTGDSLRARRNSTVPWTAQRPEEGAARRGFWATLWDIILDVAIVARGPERGAFRLALWLAFFNQAFASTAIINYAPAVLSRAGVESHTTAALFTAAVGGSKMVGVVLSFFLVDSLGRRPLLIYGSLGCSAAMGLLVVADWMVLLPFLVAGMCAFIFAFSVSWAGVFWVLLSEMFSMSVKSPAASAATAMLFLTGAVSDLVFLSLHSLLGPFCFLLFALLALAAGIYVARVLPETKGRTLQEVQDLLAGGGSGRQGSQGSRHIGELPALLPPGAERSAPAAGAPGWDRPRRGLSSLWRG